MVSRLCTPRTHFDLQYVRPDFIMLRVIAQNLIMWSRYNIFIQSQECINLSPVSCPSSFRLNVLAHFRVHPSEDWIQSQIPEIVQNGVESLGDEMGDVDEMDAEVFIQAYVNIVAGACISLGK